MSHFTENKLHCWIMGMLVLIFIAWIILLLCWPTSTYGDPGPPPNPADYPTVQGELMAWWEWCWIHPNKLWRVDKKIRVHTAGGTNIRDGMEKMKVVGAPAGRPPFASIIRYETFRPFIDWAGQTRGAMSNGWTYFTSSSTDIGQGSFDLEDLWGGGE